MIRMLAIMAIAFLTLSCANGQNSSDLEGFYSNPDYSLGLRMKSVNSTTLHGTLQSIDGVFALKATCSSGKISGALYTDAQNYPFQGTGSADGSLTLTSSAGSYTFYMMNKDHGLADMDLSPYFRDNPTAKTVSIGNAGGTPPAGTGGEVYQLVAGSQLVYYQRTSYVNDNTASSITYVNFCRDGRFSLNYDGGFSVEGSGGNAHGASYGSNIGTWSVSNQGGSPQVVLTFANGQSSANPVNLNNLRQGRWRIGNTQYALVRNKVRCN